jgi:acetyl esterase/lipase
MINGPTGQTDHLINGDEMTATVTAHERLIPGESEPIGARVYEPAVTQHDTTLVWLHGGGFTGGNLDMPEADWVGRSLAERGHLVITVDYRLANETVRYPAPSNDVLDAWRWVDANRSQLKITGSVHLGGASAGANLAAGAAIRIRDNDQVAGGTALPATLILAYPTLHAVQPAPSDDLRAVLQVLPAEYQRSPEYIAKLYTNLLPDGMTAESAAATASADGQERVWAAAIPGLVDPTGLPPILIAGSEGDPMRASAEGFVASLVEHGVDHEYFVEPGARHGHLNTPDATDAIATIDHMHAWLMQHARG